jgi:hypothetical protein
VDDSPNQQAYRRDARVLAEIGAEFLRAELPKIDVRFPRALAKLAVAAWERNDDEGLAEPETPEQYLARRRAVALALIGVEITQRGRWVNDEVFVDLSPTLVGIASDAWDDLS